MVSGPCLPNHIVPEVINCGSFSDFYFQMIDKASYDGDSLLLKFFVCRDIDRQFFEMF